MKKAILLALGSATLAGLTVFGCSSDPDPSPAAPADEAGVTDTKPKSDTRPPDDEEDAGQCPIGTAPTEVPKWVAAKPHADACSPAEMSKINALITSYGQTITFKTFQDDVTAAAEISETCRGCVFTDREQETWGPIPLNAQQNGSINYSGCYAQFSGKEECGKAYLAYDACLHGVCDDCAAAGSTRTSCYAEAASGVCKTALDDESSACTGAPKTLNDACSKIGKVIATMCAGGTGDGGAGDGGDGG